MAHLHKRRKRIILLLAAAVLAVSAICTHYDNKAKLRRYHDRNSPANPAE